MESGKRFDKIVDDKEPFNITEYQSAIRCLTYASLATGPGLSSAVGVLSQHLTKPGKEHWVGVNPKKATGRGGGVHPPCGFSKNVFFRERVKP